MVQCIESGQGGFLMLLLLCSVLSFVSAIIINYFLHDKKRAKMFTLLGCLSLSAGLFTVEYSKYIHTDSIILIIAIYVISLLPFLVFLLLAYRFNKDERNEKDKIK
jgi:glucose-6-phosphate-specific signal transduction histidine kinase